MNLPEYLGGMFLGLLLIVGGIARFIIFSDTGNHFMSVIFLGIGGVMFSYYVMKSKRTD